MPRIEGQVRSSARVLARHRLGDRLSGLFGRRTRRGSRVTVQPSAAGVEPDWPARVSADYRAVTRPTAGGQRTTTILVPLLVATKRFGGAPMAMMRIASNFLDMALSPSSTPHRATRADGPPGDLDSRLRAALRALLRRPCRYSRHQRVGRCEGGRRWSHFAP